MTETSYGSTRIDGSVRTQDGRGAVRMDCRYETDLDDLWSAITDPDRLARWIVAVGGELRLGGAIEMKFTSGAESTGRIDACEPSRRLLITLNPGTEAEGTIQAVLMTQGPTSTSLVLDATGLPLDNIAGYGGGWHTHLEDLAAYLAGNALSDWGARATQLKDAYLT